MVSIRGPACRSRLADPGAVVTAPSESTATCHSLLIGAGYGIAATGRRGSVMALVCRTVRAIVTDARARGEPRMNAHRPAAGRVRCVAGGQAARKGQGKWPKSLSM